MEDTETTARAVANACAELLPDFDARFKILATRYPCVAGFFFGMKGANLRVLPGRVRHGRHERDVTLGVYQADTHVGSRILEWQSRPDAAMDDRARRYIADQVHVLGSRERVGMRVLHLLDVADRSALPSTWPWGRDEVIYEWENDFLPDYDAADLLRDDCPALAALSSGAAGGTTREILSRALDLLLSLDCSEPVLISAIALHRFLAELHSNDRHLWMTIMNEKNVHLAARVEQDPFVQKMIDAMERRAAPVRAELERERRRSETERRQRLAQQERAEAAEAQAHAAEAQAHAAQSALEAERLSYSEEIARLRAQLRKYQMDDD